MQDRLQLSTIMAVLAVLSLGMGVIPAEQSSGLIATCHGAPLQETNSLQPRPQKASAYVRFVPDDIELLAVMRPRALYTTELFRAVERRDPQSYAWLNRQQVGQYTEDYLDCEIAVSAVLPDVEVPNWGEASQRFEMLLSSKPYELNRIDANEWEKVDSAGKSYWRARSSGFEVAPPNDAVNDPALLKAFVLVDDFCVVRSSSVRIPKLCERTSDGAWGKRLRGLPESAQFALIAEPPVLATFHSLFFNGDLPETFQPYNAAMEYALKHARSIEILLRFDDDELGSIVISTATAAEASSIFKSSGESLKWLKEFWLMCATDESPQLKLFSELVLECLENARVSHEANLVRVVFPRPKDFVIRARDQIIAYADLVSDWQ